MSNPKGFPQPRGASVAAASSRTAGIPSRTPQQYGEALGSLLDAVIANTDAGIGAVGLGANVFKSGGSFGGLLAGSAARVAARRAITPEQVAGAVLDAFSPFGGVSASTAWDLVRKNIIRDMLGKRAMGADAPFLNPAGWTRTDLCNPPQSGDFMRSVPPSCNFFGNALLEWTGSGLSGGEWKKTTYNSGLGTATWTRTFNNTPHPPSPRSPLPQLPDFGGFDKLHRRFRPHGPGSGPRLPRNPRDALLDYMKALAAYGGGLPHGAVRLAPGGPPERPATTEAGHPAPARGKEKKFRGAAVAARFATAIGFNAATEVRDGVQAIWKNIPKDRKRFYGNPTLARMASDIMNHFGDIQWTPWKAQGSSKVNAGALGDLGANAIQDGVYGLIGALGARGARATGMSRAPTNRTGAGAGGEGYSDSGGSDPVGAAANYALTHGGGAVTVVPPRKGGPVHKAPPPKKRK